MVHLPQLLSAFGKDLIAVRDGVVFNSVRDEPDHTTGGTWTNVPANVVHLLLTDTTMIVGYATAVSTPPHGKAKHLS